MLHLAVVTTGLVPVPMLQQIQLAAVMVVDIQVQMHQPIPPTLVDTAALAEVITQVLMQMLVQPTMAPSQVLMETTPVLVLQPMPQPVQQLMLQLQQLRMLQLLTMEDFQATAEASPAQRQLRMPPLITTGDMAHMEADSRMLMPMLQQRS